LANLLKNFWHLSSSSLYNVASFTSSFGNSCYLSGMTCTLSGSTLALWRIRLIVLSSPDAAESMPGAATSTSFCFADSASKATSVDVAGRLEVALDKASEVLGPGAGIDIVALIPPPNPNRLLCWSTSLSGVSWASALSGVQSPLQHPTPWPWA